MNRRTFIKSTALSLIPPTLFLKGEETFRPLQWTPFSSKLPKYEEFILIAEEYLPNPAHFEDCTIGVKLGNKYPKFIFYNIGTMIKKYEANVGDLIFIDNKKTGKKEYLLIKRLNEKGKPREYQINENSCYWITIKNLLKYTKNTPINKSNMDIIAVEQYDVCRAISVGKIINVNEKEIKTISRDFNATENKIFSYQLSTKKKSIVGWTKLPNLPNNSMAI